VLLTGGSEKDRCGNGGVVESMENQTPVSHTSHNSLGIARTLRDSHIPTATAVLLLFPTQNQKTGKEVGRCAAFSSPTFHDHSALELKIVFMIILGLENAGDPKLLFVNGKVSFRGGIMRWAEGQNGKGRRLSFEIRFVAANKGGRRKSA